MIRAECHSADSVRAVEFDATPWFEGADAESIVHIARENWSSQSIADALSSRSGYETLREVVQYAMHRLTMESYENPLWPTFAWRVDAAEALAWLEAHRPEVAARVRDVSPPLRRGS